MPRPSLPDVLDDTEATIDRIRTHVRTGAIHHAKRAAITLRIQLELLEDLVVDPALAGEG